MRSRSELERRAKDHGDGGGDLPAFIYNHGCVDADPSSQVFYSMQYAEGGRGREVNRGLW